MARLLLVLLLLPYLGSAQATIDTLHWSATRRLQLSDFRSPTQPGLGGSEFYYQIGYEARTLSTWGAPAIESFCLMFRNLSWVSETARHERTLAYNQVLFDLVEVHTRLMKAKLVALGADRRFKQQAKQIEYMTNSELGGEVNRFRAETGGGDDVTELKRWQQQVVQRLYDTPDLVTTYHTSKVGYGFFFGGGLMQPMGPISQAFTPSGGVVFGIDVALRRTIIMLHPTLYNGSIRAGFDYQNHTWESGMAVTPMLFEAGIGQIVSDAPRIRVIPYLGYRLLALAPTDRKDERYKGFSLTDYAPTGGLVLDIKLGDNTPKYDRAEANFWFIRTKLSYSPMLDTKPFAGGFINLQIGLGGFGRIRRVGYRPEPTTITLPDGQI
ncbi:hypothetical protein IC229_19835 [Spirosoma sp. BT702]|uniref:Uncharacterized protein n=1 Tax=Spirosoma profusum TaxID=2771354 RepID=A0A926XY52_9BACT|nr:hypothetical protein [Spirosoma profusum]MBD2702907.1 hypothetical protein [Spirosoma profusum]